MAQRERIGRIAAASLLLALFIAAAGKVLEYVGGHVFLGGLIAAFGEAALVGGLADWFAVRALFAHPFGIPFPHTALIPRNRRRLTAEMRNLVVNEWLPRDVLGRKLHEFDFVGQILPALPAMRPHLRDLLRAAAREVLTTIEPRPVAAWVAAGVSGGVEARQVAPWLAELVKRSREQHWLAPLLRELVKRLEIWAASANCRQFIKARLDRAATAYRERDGWKDLLLTLGEISGGVDLDEASAAVQMELRRFAAEQMNSGSHMQAMLHDGLTNIERRLRDDSAFLDHIRGVLDESDTLTTLLTRMLESLRAEALVQAEQEQSPWLDLALARADEWLARLGDDAALRERVNDWCRRLAVDLLDRHHALLGTVVEEQMNRLSDDDLTALIQKRVGADLNWIRLNGTFVGGLIGVALFLLVWLIRWATA